MLNLANAEAPNQPLPPGTYNACIVGVEVKTTKSGGEMLQVEFTILGPTQAKRKFWDNFNIKNANPQAEKIGHGQLKALALAVKLTDAQLTAFDPNMLVNKEVVAVTTIETNDQWGDKTKVKRYNAKSDSVTTAPANQFAAKQEEIPF